MGSYHSLALTASARNSDRMMFRREFLLFFSLVPLLILGSPLPQEEENPAESDSPKGLVSLISQLTGLVKTAGEVISDLSDDLETPALKEAGDKISEVGSVLEVELPDLVADHFNNFVRLVPQIKSNVSDVLANLPEVREKISERISSFPTKEEISGKLDEIVAKLPDHEIINELKDKVSEKVDNLPTREEMSNFAQKALDNIPDDTEVHGALDKLLEGTAPIIDELNETDAEI